MIAVRDPLGLIPGTMLLPPEVFFILSLCDGEHTVAEIQVEYVRRFGDLIFTEQLQKILREFDEHLLLESERAHAAQRELAEQFRAQPVRQAAHAGSAYPERAADLRAKLEAVIDAAPSSEAPKQRIRGVAAPHIDLRRGEKVYGAAYRAVRDHVRAELFFVLGIAHFGGETPLILTKKNFRTPLGEAQTEGELVERLARACPFDPFADELVHKVEHSVELQVVFLQHIFGPEVAIVPVLCNEVAGFCDKQGSPRENEALGGPLGALRELVEEAGESCCVLAGVDLSHIGRQFGDASALSPGFLATAERADRELIACLEAGDADGAFRACYAQGNRFHVCGMPALYALVYALGECRGKLLRYDQAVTWETESAVTLAAMIFW